MWQQIPFRTMALMLADAFLTMACTLVSKSHCRCAGRVKSLHLLHALISFTRRSHRKLLLFVSEPPQQVWDTYRVYGLWWRTAGPTSANNSCYSGKSQFQKLQYENEFSTIYEKKKPKPNSIISLVRRGFIGIILKYYWCSVKCILPNHISTS